MEVLGEVALAMLLGGLIGIEREIADKPAGFRTHMLVAGSAALLVGLGHFLLEAFLIDVENQGIRSDPMRIVEAIVTGVSFLGAGTIFRGQDPEVRGLTTAASILLSSAVGICVALAEFALAIGVTALAVLVLRGLKFLERKMSPRNKKKPQQELENFDSPSDGQPTVTQLTQELKAIHTQLSAMQAAHDQAQQQAATAVARATAEQEARQEYGKLADKRLAQLRALARERDQLAVRLEQLTVETERK
jgi:putative Mg2+ transporter-C (MgtC) family protein